MSAAVFHPPSWRDATHRSSQTAYRMRRIAPRCWECIAALVVVRFELVRVGSRLTHNHTLTHTQTHTEKQKLKPGSRWFELNEVPHTLWPTPTAEVTTTTVLAVYNRNAQFQTAAVDRAESWLLLYTSKPGMIIPFRRNIISTANSQMFRLIFSPSFYNK